MCTWACCSKVAAFCVRRDAGSKYLFSAVVAPARSERAASNWRASTPRRALSSLSLRFSRRKKVCSGASSTASGWSMRLTRTRLRASSRTTSQLVCSALCHHALPDGGAAPAPAPPLAAWARISAFMRWVSAAWATALSTGRSSTWRTRSSRRASRPAVSVTLVCLRCSRSCSMARCTGARWGCAVRSMRCWALCSAAIRGCMLPVSWACCCDMRSTDSRSTTRFSSRVRDRLLTSSSIWLRCRARSPSRVSTAVRRATASVTCSCAWRATVRASMDWVPASALWRASCSWMVPSFCHSSMLLTSASAATAPAMPSASHCPLPGAAAVPAWPLAVARGAVEGRAGLMPAIL